MARILVIDDEEGVRQVMAQSLRYAGHEVIEAAAARPAIEAHRARVFDLIVTDLVMGEMDGTELLRRVRAFAPDTRILAVSGARHGKIYLNMARLLGADSVLEKPFTVDVLAEAVAGALARAPRPASSRLPETCPSEAPLT